MSEKKKVYLGIECTAHTISIALITDSKEVLFERLNTYFPDTGMIPTEVARKHEETYSQWREDVVSFIRQHSLQAIGYSSDIGLPPCLILAKKIALELSERFSSMAVPCPHNLGHWEMGKMQFGNLNTGMFVYASGSNTQISYIKEENQLILVDTKDIAIGNLLDRIGRENGLGALSGPKIEELAKKYKEEGEFYSIPFPLKRNFFNFTGIQEWFSKKEWPIEKVSFYAQEICFEVLITATRKAFFLLKRHKVSPTHLIFSGGVFRNQLLTKKMLQLGNQLSLNCKDIVNPRYHGDNAVMISFLLLRKLSIK